MKLDVRTIIEESRKKGPNRRQISFTLPIETSRDLLVVCKKHNVVMSSLLTRLIEEFICNEKDEEETPSDA